MDTERDRLFELKLDAGRTLPEVIADKIRELIDVGVYKPGAKLDNESELARRMKVARSSIRTALQRLEALHMVEVRRGLGWYVKRMPPPDTVTGTLLAVDNCRVSDLLELRIGLEGLSASLAAVRASTGEIDDIRKLNKQFQEVAETGGDPDRLLEADEAFHEAIIRAAHNDLLFATYIPLTSRMREWRYDSYGVRGVPLRSVREHAKVVRYLANQDPGGATVAMNGHLQRLYDGLPDILDEPLDLTLSRQDSEPIWRDRRAEV